MPRCSAWAGPAVRRTRRSTRSRLWSAMEWTPRTCPDTAQGGVADVGAAVSDHIRQPDAGTEPVPRLVTRRPTVTNARSRRRCVLVRWPSSSVRSACASRCRSMLEAARARGRVADHVLLCGSARPGQDHDGDDHRGRDGGSAANHQRARGATRRRPGRDLVVGSARVTCCSSTRSTEWPAQRRRCCTPRWRTSGSTSSSAKARVPRRSRWICHRSPWSARPPGPACCRVHCATGSASPGSWTFTSRVSSSRCWSARPGCWTVTVRADGVREIAKPFARNAAHRQPPAAPSARLRRGAGPTDGRHRRRGASRH